MPGRGDMVTWTMANIRRTGRIWAVIPPGNGPDMEFPDEFQVMFEEVAGRDHSSYIVESLSGLGGRRRLYWPPADRLIVVAKSGAQADLSRVTRAADRQQVADMLAQWQRLSRAET